MDLMNIKFCIYLYACDAGDSPWFTFAKKKIKESLSHTFFIAQRTFPMTFLHLLKIYLILIIFSIFFLNNTCMHSSISAFIIIWIQEFVEKIILFYCGRSCGNFVMFLSWILVWIIINFKPCFILENSH